MIYEERASDAPFVERVMYGITTGSETRIRPAASHWYLVFSKRDGQTYPLVVGPWTSSGITGWTAGAEILWIRFKLGTFIPQLPTRQLVNTEAVLPQASSTSFWLQGSRWQFPTYENADTFINWLARANLLTSDQVVNRVLEDQLPETSSRTVRHRFLVATGLSQNRIRQLERAQQAMQLLQQGMSILDVVDQSGYADQPHLTRSLKQYIGYTPAQISGVSR